MKSGSFQEKPVKEEIKKGKRLYEIISGCKVSHLSECVSLFTLKLSFPGNNGYHTNIFFQSNSVVFSWYYFGFIPN